MSRTSEPDDDIRPEYDFPDEQSKSAPRGKYAGLLTPNVVRLDADAAEVFPDAKSVNEALRALATIIKAREQEQAA